MARTRSCGNIKEHARKSQKQKIIAIVQRFVLFSFHLFESDF